MRSSIRQGNGPGSGALPALRVNTPPAKAGGFGLRLKAGLIGHAADLHLNSALLINYSAQVHFCLNPSNQPNSVSITLDYEKIYNLSAA
jgi:hypothetical protein